MSVLWMLYALLVGAVLVCGALALERAADQWRWPRRGIWAAALAAASLLPMLAGRRSAESATPPGGSVTMPSVHAPAVPPSWWARAVETAVSQAARLDRLRGLATIGWGAVSLMLAVAYLAAAATLGRRRRRWSPRTVAGVEVLIATDDCGPAVVGIVRPRIVLPAWSLTIDPSPRALMLAHEAEHVRARDPLLLAMGAIGVIAMPWNLAIWWIVRRLRLAVEIDCDARVLRATRDPFAYGRLLVDVGARRAGTLPVTAPALLERRTALEQRITAMHARRPRHPLVRTAVLGVVASAAVAVACETPRPDPLAPTMATSKASVQVQALPEGPQSAEQVRSFVDERVKLAPWRGDGTQPVLAIVVQDAEGRIVRSALRPLAFVQQRRTERGPVPTVGPSEAGHALERGLARLPASADLRLTNVRLTARPGRAVAAPPSDPILGLDPDSIATVEVTKSRAGRMVPNPLSLIVIRLKAGVRLPAAPARDASR